MAPHVVPATAHLQQPLIDSVDRALSDMLRSLLADPHWRSVEGAWRSVDRFLHGVEMDGGVQLELVDASAADLLDALVQAGGDAAQTPLAKTLAERRATQDQATGHAVVVALYEFGPGAAELALLASLAAIAAAQGWPRLLARLPYGRRTQPVASFAFEEWLAPHAHEQLAWRPAALDLAALLARGFLEDGAELDPAAQVELEDLPAFIDRSGDDPRFQAVAEWFISEPQARAVSAAGVMPLLSHRSLPQAQVAGWRSISAGHSRLKGPWPG
ncbi:type VI secretion system contractile sheath large subunit [Piscinibacter sakaiensis]|uniref:type VI secretion system contractile sheath domain-containing protein n=1 Tax=Piscinibacter sakaiensis TaxID=1547922 RepID=UPI00372A3741